MRGGRAAEVVVLLILVLGTWLGFATSGLPDVVPASAPLTEFSAERAMIDLQAITAAPHPVGTPQHDKVRDYLVDRLRALGFDDVHVQAATGFNTLQGPLAATVANVVGRKRGAAAGPALLLTAHYDAVPRSFGAGDDGVGVAAILEALRALRSAPPLNRDLIVVFSDAEENGLLGAEAFVDLHAWAKDVGVVLNFEGRGNAGPVYMFQTSPGNRPLIDALAASVPGARTNSLTGEIYRHLPSDTDLSVWLHSGFPVGALNFSHVGGYTHYHTPMDNLASLDTRVLQQMGDYALGLARTLGQADLREVRTVDAVYFNAPLVGVVHYPGWWPLALAIDGGVIIVVLMAFGLWRKTLTMRGIGRGALALLLSLAIPAAVTFLGWRIIRAIHPGYAEILQGDPYNSQWYLLGFAALTVATVVEIQRRVAQRATPPEVAVAPSLLWGALGLVVALKLPGASYLFAWPVFAVAMSASWWRRSERAGRQPIALLALLALPVLVLWPPLIRALEVALTAGQLLFCSMMVALVVSLLSMPLQLAGRTRSWIVVAGVVVAVAAFVRAETMSGFSELRPHPNSIAHLIDADSARAWWVSFDKRVDAWTTPLLGEQPERRRFTDLRFRDGSVLAAPVTAPVVVTASPAEVLANDSTAGGRRIHLKIGHAGVGQFAAIYAAPATKISEMRINGRDLADGSDDRYRPTYHLGANGTVLRYYGVPEEGVDLWFTIQGNETRSLRLVSAVQGLPPGPSGPIPPRPAGMMSKPFLPTDMTITGWTIRL